MRQVKLMILSFFVLLFYGYLSSADQPVNPPPHEPPYPTEWWAPVDKSGAPSWEILPQEANYGEVILSKRTSLGVLSNFASTPFVFRDVHYASVEGFWQATKYPEGPHDPRSQNKDIQWKYTREQVQKMTAFEAKEAGNLANENMKKLGIEWVTFEGNRMSYREPGDSPFYQLILQVEKEKLKQNENVREILMQTGELVLRPDHVPGPPELKAWQYHEIWMLLRRDLALTCHSKFQKSK